MCFLVRADAGVAGTVTLTKYLPCAEHRSQHVPRQHLTEPLVEAATEAGSANPPQRDGEPQRRGGTRPASPVPGARAGLPPRPGQRQGLLDMQVPGPPLI